MMTPLDDALAGQRRDYCRISGQPTCASIDFENTSLYAHRSTWPALPFGEPFSHREYAHRLGLGVPSDLAPDLPFLRFRVQQQEWRCFALKIIAMIRGFDLNTSFSSKVGRTTWL